MPLIIVFFTSLFVAACTGVASLFGHWLIGFIVAAALVIFIFFLILGLALDEVAQSPAYKRQQVRRRRGF